MYLFGWPFYLCNYAPIYYLFMTWDVFRRYGIAYLGLDLNLCPRCKDLGTRKQSRRMRLHVK